MESAVESVFLLKKKKKKNIYIPVAWVFSEANATLEDIPKMLDTSK